MEPADRIITRMLQDASRRPFWLDRLGSSGLTTTTPLEGRCSADLVVVGAGLTGLWTVHHALDANPEREVVVLEASTISDGASGRNGGFCDASLTHGVANGLAHFEDEYPLLHRLGTENLAGLLRDLERHDIDACWEPVGELDVATAPWQVDELQDHAKLLRERGEDVVVLDRNAVRAEVRSPTFLAGVWRRSNVGLVDPARLTRGLADAALRRGARVHERTPVTSLNRTAHGLRLESPAATIDAEQVVLATNAYPGLVRPISRAVVPVYDHVLVTEPLSAARLAELGWRNRQGLSDGGNQFHYFRLTPDNRLLWGGYDALYHWRGRMGSAVEANERTERLLAAQLLDCFPQLEGVGVTHRWSGPIATTTRFTFTAGSKWDRRVAWAVGYTGLGVGASRFAARVALDLLDGEPTERTRLRMVRRAPVPFPPEPFRYLGIQLTRRALARADRRDGRRGLWLRLLDRFGVGFDS